jgi:15-cis-phytoene synthase
MNNKKLQRGFQEAKKITKKFAKTFYLASLFLPKTKKYASYAVYAICRLSDETVDDLTYPNQADSLQKLEQKIDTAYSKNEIDEPLLAAFSHIVNTYEIPKEYFSVLIQGMHMDLKIKRYANFPDLYEYCYRVAGNIGLIMLKIFRQKNKTAEYYAIKLGVAMQLTNILRDINEDFARGRIYLPQDEMNQFNITEDQLAKKKLNEEFKNFLCFQIRRCRDFYRDSLPGIKLIDNLTCKFVALAMNKLYSGILDAIEKNNYNVFTKRAHINILRKIVIIFKILLGGRSS